MLTDNLRTNAVQTRVKEVKADLRLPAEPLVVIVSGPWGVGKTELLGKLIGQVQALVEQKAVIFNELGRRGKKNFNEDTQRIPTNLNSLVVDECACCKGSAKTIAKAKGFLAANKKLVVIESSGLANGSKLTWEVEAALKTAFPTAKVRHITLAAPQMSEASFTRATNNLMAANLVVMTHTTRNSKDAGEFQTVLTKHLFNGAKIVAQGLTDVITQDEWNALLAVPTATPSNVPISINQRHASDTIAFDQIKIHLARSVAQRPEEAIRLMNAAFSKSGAQVERIKGTFADGTLDFDGSLKIISGKETLSVATTKRSEQKASGDRVIGFTTRGIFNEEAFAELGGPDVSPYAIRYARSYYPSSAELRVALKETGTLPYQTDGDAVFSEMETFARYSSRFPADYLQEFKDAWKHAITGYVQYRRDVAKLLKPYLDPAKAEALARDGVPCPDAGNILFNIGFSLSTRFSMHVFQGSKYGPVKLLSDKERVMLQGRIIATDPGTLTFRALSVAKSLDLESRDDLRAYDINGFGLAAWLGKATKTLSAPTVSAALTNISKLSAEGKADPSWKALLPKMVERCQQEFA